MDTPITRLRNLMTPLINYFAMIKSDNVSSKMSKILDNEAHKASKNIPEIRQILSQIPDDALTNNHQINNNDLLNKIDETLYRKFGDYEYVGGYNDNELYIIGERGKGLIKIEDRK